MRTPLRWAGRVLAPLLAAAVVSGGACPSFENRECAGHGTCVEAEGGSTCHCEEGYQRADCSYANVCPGDCGGNGRCIMPAADVKRINPLALGTCACNSGFSGERCTELAVHAQAPKGCDGFCFGHGRCVCGEAKRVNITRVVRIFDERGHAAPDATVTEEVRVDVRGERTSDEVTCGCDCHRGFSGFLCEETDGSNCPNACTGHGTCGPDDVCVCDAGFTGDDCGKAMASACPAACSGHGSCLSPPTCVCRAGYGGAACDELISLAPPPSPPPPPPPSAPVEATSDADAAASVARVAAEAINASAWPQYAQETADGGLGGSVEAARGAAAPGAVKGVANLGAVEQQQAAEEGTDDAAPQPTTQQQQSSPSQMVAAVAATRKTGSSRAHERRVAARETGCSGRGYIGPDGCVCADGFTGATCERLAFGCSQLSNCSGHGHCMLNVCVCEAGARGAACDTVRIAAVAPPDGSDRACLHSCSGHGSCARGTCLCDSGFVGESCAHLARARSAADSSVLASLAAGFYSTTHPTSVAAAPPPVVQLCANGCSGKGRCLPTSAPVARGQAAVGSTTHVSGAAASTRSLASRLLARMGGHVVGDVQPISSAAGAALPLASSSVATSVGGGASGASVGGGSGGVLHACSCEPGYGGHDCSQTLFSCPHNCSGAGLCAAAPLSTASTPTHMTAGLRSLQKRGSPTCLCQKGHAGAGCEVRKASCVDDCHGRGTCTQTTYGGVTAASCSCAAGFAGPSCADECASSCSGQGRCHRTAAAGLVCLCDAGFGGAACERKASCPSALSALSGAHETCAGRGSCTNGLCSCEAGFYGQDCSRDGRDHTVRASSCPSQCSGHGACLPGATCACVAGYAGADCAKRTAATSDAAMRAAVRSRASI